MHEYWLHRLSPFALQITESIGIRWYGVAYVLSFLCAGWLYRHLATRRLNPLRPDDVPDFIQWAALFGVLIGGRLGYALFYGFHKDDPFEIFRVWEGGMSSHGGILGLVLFTLYWSKKRGVSWTGIGDSLVVVAPVGLFLVRMANFINGELYGRVASVSWAMLFPGEIRERGELLAGSVLEGRDVDEIISLSRVDDGVANILRKILTPRHPSQIYEALLEGVLLFTMLWIIRTRCRVPRGVLTGTFFVGYAILRIIGEQFRQPEDWTYGMPRGVFLSIFMIAIGFVFWAWAYRQQEFEEGLMEGRGEENRRDA